MDKITFDDFKKLELKVGKVLSAVPVEKSEKLLRLQVDFGREKRQVISGIAKSYSPEDLIDKSFVFVTNLESRMIMGLESQGMLIAADVEGKPVFLQLAQSVPNGSPLM